jgi:hypothetical protein
LHARKRSLCDGGQGKNASQRQLVANPAGELARELENHRAYYLRADGLRADKQSRNLLSAAEDLALEAKPGTLEECARC